MEFTQQEIQNMLEVFQRGKEKPKANTPEDFERWLKGSLTVKTEPAAEGPSTAAQSSSVVYQRFPRIPPFSGDRHGKDTPYYVWSYHVNSLLESKSYPKDVKDQTIRDSLNGDAAKIAVNMRHGSDISALLRKLKIIFDVADRKESRMAQFYSAKQKDDEDVSMWSCRLEELLTHAIKDSPGHVDGDEMLRNMLWTGLRPSLKNISGHKFDSSDNFDDLLQALREIENDQLCSAQPSKPTITATAKRATEQPPPEWKKEMDDVKAMLNKRLLTWKPAHSDLYSGKGITLCSVPIAMFVFFFVFCVGSLAPTAVSLPTTQPGCHVNGQYHPDGSSYQPSACKHCFCSNGRGVCAIADCFFTPCVDPVHDPKVCCPVCPNGSNCWASKQIIPAGKDIQIDDHTTCRCPNPGFGRNQAVCTIAMQTVTVLPVVIP